MEFFDEQEIVVLGQNLACIRISLYCNIKLVWQPAWKALFSYSTYVLVPFLVAVVKQCNILHAYVKYSTKLCEVHLLIRLNLFSVQNKHLYF